MLSWCHSVTVFKEWKEFVYFFQSRKAVNSVLFYTLRGSLLNIPCYIPRYVLYSVWKGQVIFTSVIQIWYSHFVLQHSAAHMAHICTSDSYDIIIYIYIYVCVCVCVCVTDIHCLHHVTGCNTVYLCDSLFSVYYINLDDLTGYLFWSYIFTSFVFHYHICFLHLHGRSVVPLWRLFGCF